ncbi:REJ domain protein (macronuclear) [Tetrahymena thermophila SB210]|uniref:REJ domain protein n=1 Tax=Tetrahymena thermophila (strain SB210) TaxID=312017 RepID=Q22D57_TETTS|nr:REJ domain protein [Tetrahymena thermophila SB210]EAR83196.2 REJ domain protein [Tetrahymena thermophila SB210]|eukprot:XP_001030859.2 REJ domain protein [Tetrahymena thermophila SB210]
MKYYQVTALLVFIFNIISVNCISLYKNCTQILMEDKFNLNRSECLINQGSPDNVNEYTQNCKYLQSDQCMGITQLTCNGTVSNYISANTCKSNSLFTMNFKQNRFIYRLKLRLAIIISSNQQITPISSFLSINNKFLSYDNQAFQQFCSDTSPFYSNIFDQVVYNINQDYLNISFSALPNYSKSFSTYLKEIFLAVEYCPDNCSSCSSSGCLQCNSGYYLDNQQCLQCSLSCQTCNNPSNCLTCSSNTKQLDQQNQCDCKNPKDQRNNYVECSYQNIAVLNVYLSNTTPQLIIDLGSPFKALSKDSVSSQQLCQYIFDPQTLNLIGQNSQCFIQANQIIVNLTDSSTIMENNSIKILPNTLQFLDYQVPIDTFYQNQVFQKSVSDPLLEFKYNSIENTCNPIGIEFKSIKNDAQRGFLNIQWILQEVTGQLTAGQKQQIDNLFQIANQNQNTFLIIKPELIPPNQNITIIFNYTLKVNKNGQQIFQIFYQKQKMIKANYLQSSYPPIYRFQSLNYYFQFSIQICELGSQIFIQQESLDIQIISPELSLIQKNMQNYNQSYFELDIPPYSLPSNSVFNFSVIFSIHSQSNIKTELNIAQNIETSNLYVTIQGGSNQIVNYNKKLYLVSDFQDLEIQNSNSQENLQFKWTCFNPTNKDHICYDQKNQQIQLQQGQNSISILENTFQPYTIIIFTITITKLNRSQSFSTTCFFNDIDIPPLKVISPLKQQNQRVNLNQELSFQLIHENNNNLDNLQYTGTISYKNKVVGFVKFDYFQVKFRIQNYFNQIDSQFNTLQIRFTVSNPSYSSPSISVQDIQINIPPQNCQLIITPSEGMAIQTFFSIQLSNCQDQDQPLTYQFFYYMNQFEYQQELNGPYDINRRQINDQSINNMVETILPSGDIIIMAQVIDSLYATFNITQTIKVYKQNKTDEQYQQLANQIIQQQQQTQPQLDQKLVTLAVIGDDISINQQLANSKLIDYLKMTMISQLCENSKQLPTFSLLPTIANKVIARLQQTNFQIENKNKSKIINQIKYNILNINSILLTNSLTQIQKDNDLVIQNLIDQFKILNYTINQNSSNFPEDLQTYDNLSSQIGQMLSNQMQPNQGEVVLKANLSNILINQITQQFISRYAIVQATPSQKQTNTYQIVQSTYYQNIYENTTSFQKYVQKLKDIDSNFQYSKNSLISIQINNNQNTTFTDIIYSFNCVNYSQKYQITCLQQAINEWTKEYCSLIYQNNNNYQCLCKYQYPTTIIEDIDDMIIKQEKEVKSQDKFIFMYSIMQLLLAITLIWLILFVYGKNLDFKSEQKINLINLLENKELKDYQQKYQQQIQVLSSQTQQTQQQFLTTPMHTHAKLISNSVNIENNFQARFYQKYMMQKSVLQRKKTFIKLKDQNNVKQITKQLDIEEDEEDLTIEKIQQSEKIPEKNYIENTQKNTQIQISEQTKQNFQQISYFKKLVSLHFTIGTFYTFDKQISRSTRFTLLFFKITHILVISISFAQYNQVEEILLTAIIDGVLLEIIFLLIQQFIKQKNIGKCLSLFSLIIMLIIYFYIAMIMSYAKEYDEFQDFLILFGISISINIFIFQFIISSWIIIIINNFFKNTDDINFYSQLFHVLDMQSFLLYIDV